MTSGGERVGPPQHLPEVFRGEQFGQHGAQLPHRRRCGHPVAHHVPDHERHATAVQRDRVEPVAAGRLLLPGHQVPGGDPGPRQHRQGGGQQRLPEFGHDPAAGRVPALRLRRPLPGRPLVRHPAGDVGGHDQQPVDRTVGGPPRRHGEVGEDLPHAPLAQVDLRPPLGARLRLTGRVHPVEQLVNLLPGEFGEGVPVRHADHA